MPISTITTNDTIGIHVTRTSQLITAFNALESAGAINASITAQTAFGVANSAFANGNANFIIIQTVSGVANDAYIQANTARDTGNLAFANANTTHTLTVAAFTQANTARDAANTATIIGSSAFNQANTATTIGSSAFNQANNALSAANSVPTVEAQINSASETEFSDADMLTARKNSNGILIKWSWSNVKSALANVFISISNIANASQFRSATAGKIITADVAQSAMNSVAITYAPSITIDHRSGVFQTLTLTGNPSITANNLQDGWPLTLRITQDATGSRVPTFNGTLFDLAELGIPDISTAPNKVDYLFFMADGQRGKLRYTGMSKDSV